MASCWGEKLKISIFGQSHGEAIGVTVDGLPPGFDVDFEKLSRFMERRAPGRMDIATKRKEGDKVKVLSGIYNGKTCGAPLCAVIENKDVQSTAYEQFINMPRPSHADYSAHIKYKGFEDNRGGGHFSGRLTAPLCIAGGIALQILEKNNIYIGARIKCIRDIFDVDIGVLPKPSDFLSLESSDLPVIDEEAKKNMRLEIINAKDSRDSVGGIVECVIFGMPQGCGNPMFDGVENKIASIVFGIPAVKGVEFGSGFFGSHLRGSQNNDGFIIDSKGEIRTRTNNHGGSLGGISSGMPIVFSAAIKPTPSIGVCQKTVSISQKRETELEINGRHDPCIVPRAVPCVIAAAAIAVLDMLMTDGFIG